MATEPVLNTEKFEGDGPVTAAIAASTKYYALGHVIGAPLGALASLRIDPEKPWGQWIEKHLKVPELKIPLTELRYNIPARWTSAAALGFFGFLAMPWVTGALGVILSHKNSSNGINQFHRIQDQLNDTLKENAALQTQLVELSSKKPDAVPPAPAAHHAKAIDASAADAPSADEPSVSHHHDVQHTPGAHTSGHVKHESHQAALNAQSSDSAHLGI